MGMSRYAILTGVSTVTMLALLNGCAAKNFSLGDAGSGAETEQKRTSYVINSDRGSVAGIEIGMSEDELRQAGWPYEKRTEIQEGDEYKIYDIRFAGDAWVECTLNLENVLARIESKSSEVRDRNGLGAGSTLRELRQGYPLGRLIKGIAEGRYVSFVTGTRLIFRFDPKNLEEACFDYRQECVIDEGMVVQSITIGRDAPK